MTVSAETASLSALSDQALLHALGELIFRARCSETDLLAHLAEVDARGLYLGEGCSSMFDYCTGVLHFSEAEAYHRIHAARAARRFPIVLDRVRRGEIHLTGVNLLAPHLTRENCVQLLALARHQSKRAIAELLADRAPKPAAPAQVRKLPAPPAPVTRDPAKRTAVPVASPPLTPAHHGPPEPLGRARYKVQFTADQTLQEKLREAQALLRHQIPDGDLARVFDRALTLLIADAKRKKFGQTSRPAAREASKASSRHIPAHVRRALYKRDEGCCAFVARGGRRCGSPDFLEFHHKQAWARSKRHSVEGIELRCRAHNHYAAVQDFGAEHMARCRSPTAPGGSSHGAGHSPSRAGY